MSMLTRSTVRKVILNRWRKKRGTEMTQVRGDMYDWLEARLMNIIDKEVIEHHPSLGKTIRPPVEM